MKVFARCFNMWRNLDLDKPTVTGFGWFALSRLRLDSHCWGGGAWLIFSRILDGWTIPAFHKWVFICADQNKTPRDLDRLSQQAPFGFILINSTPLSNSICLLWPGSCLHSAEWCLKCCRSRRIILHFKHDLCWMSSRQHHYCSFIDDISPTSWQLHSLCVSVCVWSPS